METIEKVKTCDIHIEFSQDELFGYNINSIDTKDGMKIHPDQLRIIARALSRLAVHMWVEIDKAIGITKEDEK